MSDEERKAEWWERATMGRREGDDLGDKERKGIWWECAAMGRGEGGDEVAMRKGRGYGGSAQQWGERKVMH